MPKDGSTALKRLIRERLGNQCAICTALERLELDHIDPLTRTSRRMTDTQWREHEKLGYLQVLCHDCHVYKSRKDRATKAGQRERWEHGTTTGYFAMKCKCDDCRRAMQDYGKARRAIGKR